MNIKTIDVNAKEWFDKINGNSYFSATIILNYAMKNNKVLLIPFTYGYNDHYEEVSFTEIQKELKFKSTKPLWKFCSDNKIILRHNKQENCLKRDLIK